MQILNAREILRKKIMLENNIITYNAKSQGLFTLPLDSYSYSERLLPYTERALTWEDVTKIYQLRLSICCMVNAARPWQVYRRCNFHFQWHFHFVAAVAKSLQSCPTLCDPTDGSPPGSPIPGILQVRTLEWVAISFSSACKWKVKVKSLSHVRLLATSWTAAYQAPMSMGFSRQEYWNGVPLPSPFHFVRDHKLKIFLMIREKKVGGAFLYVKFLKMAVNE